MQFLTDERCKYVWKRSPGQEQLFDLIADPLECHDLAAGRSLIVPTPARLHRTTPYPAPTQLRLTGGVHVSTLVLVCGPNGVGRPTVSRAVLERLTQSAPVESEWCRMTNRT